MAYPQKPCKHESDPFLELHERGAKLILLNLDKSPARGFVAATPADIQSHTGDFGIFPISAKTICIDVDEGDPQTILDINARYRGARVIGVDSNPYRIQKAKELGAAAVINPMDQDALRQALDLTQQRRGGDKSVDCAGAAVAHRLCIDATRRKGQAAFVGECSADTVLRISPDMIRKGLTLIGSWHYNLADSLRIMDMIADIGNQLDQFISHRFSMDDIQQAWETQLSGQCAKVILKPWEERDV